MNDALVREIESLNFMLVATIGTNSSYVNHLKAGSLTNLVSELKTKNDFGEEYLKDTPGAEGPGYLVIKDLSAKMVLPGADYAAVAANRYSGGGSHDRTVNRLLAWITAKA